MTIGITCAVTRQEKRLKDIWLFSSDSADLELIAGHPQGYISQ